MITEKLLNSMEERYKTYGLPDYEVKQLIDEVRTLQQENSRLCPVADLDAVTSLRAELQQAQEQVQTLESLLDAANRDAHRLAEAIVVSPWNGKAGDEALKLHQARYQVGEVTATKDSDGVYVNIHLSVPGIENLRNAIIGGGLRFENIHPNPENVRTSQSAESDTMINLTPGWNPGLYSPAHGGTYRVRSLKPGSDTLDEKTCCYDVEVGWSTPDEVIEWRELNAN